MTMRQHVGVMAVGIFLMQSSAVYAQHKNLPNGRPFQILQASIANIDTALQAQIAFLQAQLDANAANDAAQSQLIGALQAAVSQFEHRMTGAQASIDQLTQYNVMHEALFRQQMARIDVLETQVTSETKINELFDLYNLQQSMIANIRNQVTLLGLQTNASRDHLAMVSNQLFALIPRFEATARWLASGCPVGSSIRQVSLFGVVCEQDTSAAASFQFVAPFTTIGAGAMAISDRFCPPSTPIETWVATGGGFSVDPGGQVLESGRTSAGNGWWVKIFNANSTVIRARANVTCALSSR